MATLNNWTTNNKKVASGILCFILFILSLFLKLQIIAALLFISVVIIFSQSIGLNITDFIEKIIIELSKHGIKASVTLRRNLFGDLVVPSPAENLDDVKNTEKLMPDNQITQAYYFLLAGQNYEAIEKYKGALETADEYMKKNILINIGFALLKLYEKTKEIKFLDESINASKESLSTPPAGGYRSKINLAQAYIYKEQYMDAYHLYREAEQRPAVGDPENIKLIMIVKYYKAVSIKNILQKAGSEGDRNELIEEAKIALIESSEMALQALPTEEYNLFILDVDKLRKEIKKFKR
jgi:tetratricopeptide (TPR) repeat protein